jgi:2-polyprenyl-3-methyl-5-hydroxy-6-metoxy-1,4-benzoquinol methylase
MIIKTHAINYMNEIAETSPLIKKFINHAEKGMALDIGFGGQDSIFLSKNGFEVTAIDIDKRKADALMEISKKENLPINVQSEDIRSFGFTADTYQIVIAMNSLFFLAHAEFKKIIDNIKKSLKNGGVVIISSFTINDSMYKKLENSVKKIDEQSFQDDSGHSWTFLKEEELKNIFSDFNILFYKEASIQDPGHEGWAEPHVHSVARIVAKK